MALTRPLDRIVLRRSPRKSGSLLLLAASLAAVVFSVFSGGQHVQAATSSNVNFQARLQTSAGSIVPDGNYNIEFKLYNASSSSGSSQGSCTGDSACLWTETRTGANVVTVKNGYLTVNLGSVTALPSIDWSQQLWLTMRVGGTGTPSWDPEMSPRLLLTATPYAFYAGNSATLGGLTASQFLQNTTSPQSANAYITAATSGSVAATLQGNAAGSANIMNIRDGSGNLVADFDAFGNLFAQQITTNDTLTVNTYGASHNALAVVQNAASASVPVLTVKGGATPGAGADLLQVQNSSSQSLAGFNNAGQLYLGRASGATGSLKLYNSTNNNTVSIQSGTTSGSYTLTLPTALGATGNCLSDTTGTGVLGWAACGGGGSGVSAIGTIDSQTKSTNGAVISGTTLYMQSADTTNPGLVTTGTQTFAGNKAFQTTTNSNLGFQVQNASGGSIFVVDTTSTNYLSNPGFEVNANNWAANGSASAPAQQSTNSNVYDGYNSLTTTTTALANDGVRTTGFTNSPTFATSASWNFSFYLKTSVAMAATLQAGYNIGAGDVTCTLTSTTTVTTGFTRYSCPITLTSGQTIASLFIRQSDATSRIFYVDDAQLTATASVMPFGLGGLQLRGVVTNPVSFMSATNSTSAFQISNAAGTNMLTVDSLNNNINVNANLQIAGTQVISSTRAISNITGLTQSSGATSLTNTGFTNTSSGSSTFKTSANSTTAFQVQDSNNTPIFGVDTTSPAANLVTNPGFEANTTGWANKGTGALTRITTPASALLYGIGSGQLVTGAAANNGASFAVALTLGTTYNVSFYARASTGTATGINVGYTNTGGDQDCLTSQSIASTGFTRFTCSFTVSGTAGTAIYIKQTGTSTQTIYLDGWQLLGSGATSATPYSLGALQLNGLVNSQLALQNTNDSTTAFQIQNAAGTSNLLVADTLNGRVGVGVGSPAYKLDIGGDINISNGSVYRVNGVAGSSSIACSGGQLLQNATTVGGIVTAGSCISAASVGSGVTTVGPIAASSNANGATITGATINLTPADATNGGVLTNTTQSILGAKTFTTSVTTPTLNVTTALQTGGTQRIDATGNLSNIGTYSGSGNITSTGGVLNMQGSGTNSLTGNLSIGGTYAMNNSGVNYSWTTAGGTDLSWKTIAFVTEPTGTYVGTSFAITALEAGCNYGCSSQYGDRLNFFASIVRSGAVQDDTVSATISGPYNGYVRVVKTSSSAYELQVSQALNNENVTFQVQVTSGTTSGISWVNSPVNGSTSGTIYTSLRNNNDYMTNVWSTSSIGVGANNTYALYAQDASNYVVLDVDTTNRQVFLNNIDALTTSTAPGAITRTSRVNAQSVSGPYGSSGFTPSGTFTPAAGTVLIANIELLKDTNATNLNTAGTDITISGGGLTWVPITGVARTVGNTYDVGSRSFYAIVGNSPPSNMQVTADCGSFAIYRYNVNVDEYTNVDQTTPVTGAVTGNRLSANNNTWTATLGATPTANDVKIAFSAIDEDVTPSAYSTPAGWTQLYDQGPPVAGDGPESQILYQTGSTSTTLNWALTGNVDMSPSATTVYGGYIIKQSASSVTTGAINIGTYGNATDITMKATDSFQIQNSAGADLFSIDMTNKIVKLGGALQGTTVIDDRNVTTTATINETTPALGYYLSANSGTTNSNTTTTFNITGINDNEGTVVFISLRAIKGSTGNARTTSAVVTINGNYVATSGTSNQTGSSTTIEAMQVMRLNGVWRIIGYNNLDSDTADLAEWIHYTGAQPQPGQLLAVGDDKINGSVKLTSGAYDDTMIGIVTTNPAQTFSNNEDGHSVRLALTGRVPAQVSTENGPIEAGDYLTASSIPGVAMKATKPGRMVGIALTGYNGSGQGTVLIQVQPGYAVPSYGAAQLFDNGQAASAAPTGAGSIQGDQLMDNRIDTLTQQVGDLTGKLQGLQSAVDGLGTNLNTGNIKSTGLTVNGTTTANGDLTVTGTAKISNLELSNHLVTKGDAPKVELLPAGGTGSNAKVTVSGNDITGVLTVVAGDNPVADDLLRLTFNKEYATAPQVVLTPVGKGSAALQPYVDLPTGKDFQLGIIGLPATGETYRFNYQVLQ